MDPLIGIRISKSSLSCEGARNDPQFSLTKAEVVKIEGNSYRVEMSVSFLSSSFLLALRPPCVFVTCT